MEGREVKAHLTLPCLISVERECFVPRLPSLKLKIRGKKKEIYRITIQEMEDQEVEHYGLKGSATRVKKIFPPVRTARREAVYLEKKEAARYIYKILEPYIQEEA